MPRPPTAIAAPLALLALISAACGGQDTRPVGRARCPDIAIEKQEEERRTGRPPRETRAITVYSGRSEQLVGPLLDRLQREAGVRAEVRYGDTAELAATILEEGRNSPADVFLAQDAGALGALEQRGRFAPLPVSILDRVPERFRSQAGRWVGTSGRVRVIAYDCGAMTEEEVPDSVFALTDPAWRGEVGWAPTNGSFQVFVTALRALRGEEAAETWLRDMKANDPKVYPNNDAIVEAIADGEIELGLVNHYYPYEIREEIPNAPVAAHFLPGGDPGGLINVAGAGILDTSKSKELAARFIEFLLSNEGQEYFVERTFEYPVVAGVEPFEGLPSLDTLQAPNVDLSQLADLEGTLDLLKKVGLV